MNNTVAQSIFDMIEETKDHPREFAWSTLSQDLFYNPSEVLYEGTLFTKKSNGEKTSSQYVLTLKGLYKCKVFIKNTLVWQ